MRPLPPRYRRLQLQIAALFVFACLLYANTLGHDYALDDAIVITDNSVVQRGVAGWPDLFTHDTFYGFFGETERASLVEGGRYRPLTPALFAVEQEISEGPFLHHLLNVLWYGVLVVVVFGLLRELVRGQDHPWWLPLAGAAIFAAHPVHTEAVANIKGRDEILALLGAAAAAWMVLRFAGRKGSWIWQVGAGLLFFLGCLSKENAVTFAAVIPLLIYVSGRSLRAALPVVVAAAAYLLLRFVFIGSGVGEASTELMNNPFLREAGGSTVAMDFFERLPTVLYTGLLYLRLLVFPMGLVHDYYPAAIELRSWSDPWVIISLLIQGALLFWATLNLRSRHTLIAAGIWLYALTLLPVSNLLFSVGTFMSERFLFMPSLGFVLAVTVLLARLRAGAWVLLALVVGGSILTVARNPVWKDNYTLFTTDLTRQPRSAKLLNAAAGARIDRYQRMSPEARVGQEGLLLTAEEDLTTALSIHPRYGNAYLLRGNARLLLDRYDESIADYHAATANGLPAGTVDGNLIIALQRAGRKAGEERNDTQAALGYLRQAEQLKPEDYETLRLIGLSYGVSGRPREALDYFERALRLRPENEGARRNVAIARQQLGLPASGE